MLRASAMADCCVGTYIQSSHEHAAWLLGAEAKLLFCSDTSGLQNAQCVPWAKHQVGAAVWQGEELQGAGEGFLAVKKSWPSTLRTLFGDHARYETTYFQPFKVNSLHPPEMQRRCCIWQPAAIRQSLSD